MGYNLEFREVIGKAIVANLFSNSGIILEKTWNVFWDRNRQVKEIFRFLFI
jgi:hypothetical protein